MVDSITNDFVTTLFGTQSNFTLGATKKTNFFEEYNKKCQEALKQMEEEKARKQAEIQFENRCNAINSIIEENPGTPKNINTKELALSIVEIAQSVGIDPLLLACICKKESDFDQKKLGENGKGIAQITSIVPEDMYVRPGSYDPDLKKLIDKYGSLSKVFAAKTANSELKLGDFGEMLFKYKTPVALFESLKKDRDLNLKCAAYLLRFNLKASNGDVRTAIEEYNRTKNKKSYANKVIRYMDNARSLVRLNAYY